MATVSEVKAKMLDRLMEMDISSVSISELKQHADVLKILSDVNEKTYSETLVEMAEKMNASRQTETPIGGLLGIGCA